MEVLKRLIDERASAWEQYKAFLEEDRAGEDRADGPDFTAEEVAKDERFREDLDRLDTRIEELTELEARNKRAAEQREEFEEITGRSAEREEARTAEADTEQLRKFLRGEVRAFEVNLAGLGTHVDRASGAYEMRDMTVGTTTAGGHAVPTAFRAQLYEHLVESSAIRQTNVTVLTTAGGENLQVPKTTAAGTAAIVGEGTALAEADPAIGQVTLGAWKYGQLLQVSTELIMDEAVDLIGFLARDAGRALGNASGAHFVTGTGTNQPLGVMVAAGTGVTGGTGIVGVPTSNELIDLFYSVADPYAANGFWLMRRATEGKIRKIKDSNGQYMWQPGLQVGVPNMILGRPLVTDPNVAATGTNNLAVAFGDFSAYFIRDVAGVRFESSEHFAFSSDLVTYRAILRTDGDLIDLTGAIKTMAGGAS